MYQYNFTFEMATSNKSQSKYSIQHGDITYKGLLMWSLYSIMNAQPMFHQDTVVGDSGTNNTGITRSTRRNELLDPLCKQVYILQVTVFII